MCTHNDSLELLTKGIDSKNRRLFITDSIELDTITQLDIGIAAISEISNDATTPITFVIRSHGGDVYAAFGIVDLMKTSPMPINSFICGPAQSSAGIIAVCATGTRAITSNSTLLLHQVSVHDIDSSNMDELTTLAQVSKNLNAQQASLLSSYSNQTKDYWTKILKKEKHLTPQEALELKLIDQII